MVDPTVTFFVYAGQYQADAAAFLGQGEPPEYVAVVGKPDTYETEDEDGEPQTYVSIQPEAIRTVDVEERDKWVQETAKQTLERTWEIVDDEDDAGVDAEMALEQYGSDLSEYHEGAVEALESLDDSRE